MVTSDPLTPAERAVRALLDDPEALHEAAEQARLAWERTPAGKAAVARCAATVGGFRVRLPAEARKGGP